MKKLIISILVLAFVLALVGYGAVGFTSTDGGGGVTSSVVNPTATRFSRPGIEPMATHAPRLTPTPYVQQSPTPYLYPTTNAPFVRPHAF